MKQPHIQLDESLNVRYAILPGDPRRAERIASHMSEVEDLGMNREYRSLVGAYRGARILAMSTGMGGVSTGIAVEELHNIGVTHAIRIGSCGALQTDIAPGELLIAAGAVRDDGTSRAYVREGYPAVRCRRASARRASPTASASSAATRAFTSMTSRRSTNTGRKRACSAATWRPRRC